MTLHPGTDAGRQPAAVLTGPGAIALVDIAVPTPGPRQVLVEVAAVGVCGSDVHYYEHGRIADFVVTAPLVLGHEAGGTITAVGEQVDPARIGERVALEPQETCGRCEQCLAGRYNLCPDVRFFATPPVDGAFTRFVVLDEVRAHPVPDTLSDGAAALIEPLSVAVWANQKAAVQPGDRVLVTGGGPIGLLCLQVARSRGASWVGVSDVAASRLAAAARFGADSVIDARAAGVDTVPPVDVLLECSGSPQAVAAGFAAVAPAGRVVLVGMGPASMELPVSLIQARELTVTGTFRYAGAYPAAIALAASGRVDLDALITGRYPLAEAERALRAGHDDPDALKVLVEPGR